MNLVRLSLCLPLLVVAIGPGQPAYADPPPICSIPKSGKTMSCPKSFQVVDGPNDGTPDTIYENDPVMLFHYCTPRRNGMICEGWPQEYGSIGNLTYQWSIRVGGVLHTYPASTNPVRTVSCSPLQGVEATLTITNGTYQATSTNSYGCGNEIQ